MRFGAPPRLRRDGVALAVCAAGYLALVRVVSNSYYQLMLTLVPIWAVMGLSWNLLPVTAGWSRSGTRRSSASAPIR